MKPTTNLTTLAAALSLTTVLVACGGGGGSTDIAGIGGSGFVSSGTITGFGSVFVNGVKFETNTASFDIEGVPGTQEDLALGMVVKVNGTINPDGITGVATKIIFDDDLQGPVSGYPTDTTNLTTATFTVMNTSVQIDRRTTHFDADNGGINFDDIANGDMVELRVESIGGKVKSFLFYEETKASKIKKKLLSLGWTFVYMRLLGS